MLSIHYKHPVMGYHACGMGDRHLITMTDDLTQVTCQKCKNTVTGRGSNRQIGDRPKVPKKIRINADLNDKLIELSATTKRSQIDIIETAIEQYLA